MKWAIMAMLALIPASGWAGDALYIDEERHDTQTVADDALVNVVVASNRWPDCSTDATTIADIFRIEGARSDQDKAMALWKWFRLLVSATSSPTFEGETCGREQMVHDPHKILTVYGANQCDGMSWAMVPLWRAAGYMALDECHLGHTIASLRYRDQDGQLRFHDFDPQRRFIHWDSQHDRVGTWSLPLMRGVVQRHLTSPLTVHTLRTSLRIGETLDRRWDGEGLVIYPGPPQQIIAPDDSKRKYFEFHPGRRDGIYAAAGEERQTFLADTNPEHFAQTLAPESTNVACSRVGAGPALLHPARPGAAAELIYRIASPYVAVEGNCEATLIKADPLDVCRLSLSRDGIHWLVIFEKKSVGEEQVRIDLGRAAREMGRPHIYTAYAFFIKAELSSVHDINGVGLSRLVVSAFRELNKRTLPNLLPGENILRVTADKIAPGQALELEVRYRVDGKSQVVTQQISNFPHYFRIDVPGVTSRVLDNYDTDFNNDALQMEALRLKLVPAGKESPSLAETDGRAKFAASCPNPQLARLVVKKEVPTYETAVSQVSGFFPQSNAVWTDQAKYSQLVETFKKGTTVERWVAAEDLGNYPQAVDLLCAELPKSDNDLMLFIIKALAQIKDEKAVGPLLEQWKRAPGGAPGARYIPDALAAIGDASVVPALVKPLRKCRFDYRFHIAHALGILGGPLAEDTLRDLAQNDPLRANREEAAEGVARLKTLAVNPGRETAKTESSGVANRNENGNREGK